MIVYIEDTLIENFLITYLIINIIYSFINEDKSKIRQVIASVFSAVVALIYPLLKLNNILMFLIKIFIGYIITLIAYKTTSMKKQTFFYCMFLFITAIYGGVTLMIYFCVYGNFESSQKLPSILIIFSMFVITYFLKQCTLRLYKKKQINNFLYDIVLTNDDVKIKTKAYLDSGNILNDPVENKPIVLVNYKVFSKLNKNYSIEDMLRQNVSNLKKGHYIKVKTATGTDNILAFRIDSLEILKDNSKIVLSEPIFALSKVKLSGLDCDIVLNPKLLKGD